jgi:hypothetical protein
MTFVWVLTGEGGGACCVEALRSDIPCRLEYHVPGRPGDPLRVHLLVDPRSSFRTTKFFSISKLEDQLYVLRHLRFFLPF